MRTRLILAGTLILIMVMVLAIPFSATARQSTADGTPPPAPAVTAPLKWFLSAQTAAGGYNMAQVGADGGDKVTLNPDASAIWIDTTVATGDTVYPAGTWYFDVFTDQDWGTNGSACSVQIGVWNGTAFVAFSNVITYPSLYFANYPANDIRHLKTQSKSNTVKSNERLAIRITNNHTEAREVFTYTDVNKNGSYFQFEITPTPTPTPTTTTTTTTTTTPPTTTTTTTTPAGGGGGGGGGGGSVPEPSPTTAVPTAPAPVVGVTSLSGKINSATGAFLTSVTAYSDDGKARLDISSGTIGRKANGTALTEIKITRVNNPGGAPPAGALFRVGDIFYKFEPAGTKFSGAGLGMVLITLPYDPVPGTEPFIAFWDTGATPPGWNAINPPFSVNTANNTISGYTNHFTVYTVLALNIATPTTTTTGTPAPSTSPASATPRPSTTAPVAATTTATTTTASISTTAAQTAVTSDPVTSAPVTSNESKPVNWFLIAGIAVAAAAILTVGVLILKNRKK